MGGGGVDWPERGRLVSQIDNNTLHSHKAPKSDTFYGAHGIVLVSFGDFSNKMAQNLLNARYHGIFVAKQ